MDEQGMSFWDHLDVLRSVILRMIVVTIVVAVAAFCLKTQLFDIVLAPTRNSFLTYRLVGAPPFTLRLVNIGLTELWGIQRSGFFNGRGKWAKGFENQRV